MIRLFKALLTLLLITLLVVNGCKDDSSTEPQNPPEEKYAMAPPVGVSININYEPTKGYVAAVTWEPSADEGKDNFTGYAVVIYEVDFDGKRIDGLPYVDSSLASMEGSHSYSFAGLDKNKFYKAKAYSVSFNDMFSEGVECSQMAAIPELAPPVNANVNLGQPSGSNATVSWSASTDEALDEFVGYAAATYEVTGYGSKLNMFDSVIVTKPAHNYVVSDILMGKYYKTYIYSILDNGDHSRPLETNTYAAVIKGSGEIDERSSSYYAKSGFGWNAAGAGVQSAYSSINAASIDIVCRKETNGAVYTLYSPTSLTTPLSGARTTKFASLSYDEWNKSSFSMEPNLNSVAITVGEVILLKNQDDYYIKLRITSISNMGSNSFVTVTFDYKFQTAQGLRAAKQ